MVVGCLERSNISRAKHADLCETVASPGEWLLAKSLNEQIRHQSGVTAVSVWKWMDGNQPVMNAGGKLVGSV